jgi:hypothetical protein
MVEAAAVVEELGSPSFKHVNGFLNILWGGGWIPFTIFDIEFGIESIIVGALLCYKVFDPKISSQAVGVDRVGLLSM